MFGVNWNDSQTLWLNIINLSLGLVSLVCCAAIGYGVLQDLREKSRKRALNQSLERGASAFVKGYDGHMFDLPGLGLTMADGGETLETPASDAPKAKKTTKTVRKPGK